MWNSSQAVFENEQEVKFIHVETAQRCEIFQLQIVMQSLSSVQNYLIYFSLFKWQSFKLILIPQALFKEYIIRLKASQQ